MVNPQIQENGFGHTALASCSPSETGEAALARTLTCGTKVTGNPFC